MPQTGDAPVQKAVVTFDGSDAVLGFSGTAWTETVGEISLTVWLDGQPLGGALSIYANSTGMHMSLGRSWVHCPGVSAGQHELMIVAGPNTITDQNDRVNLTLLQLGDGLELRTTSDLPCPSGSGGIPLSQQRFELQGGPCLLSSSGSGWVTNAGALVSFWMLIDGGDAYANQVYANNSEQHLAAVPADGVFGPSERGEHEIALNSNSTTSTDQGDIAHLTAIEFVDPTAAPDVVPMNPWLQSAQAASQQGAGYVAQSTFQSAGGTLLFRTSMSGWTQQQNTMIGAAIEIDGTPMGNLELFANPANTHLTMPSNDLVVTGVPAGQHSFAIQAGAFTVTDQNDTVSVLALEFG